MPAKVIIRADGNAHIGLGHVVRCLALAEMLRPDFECRFLIREPLPALRVQIAAICPDWLELPADANPEQEARQVAAQVQAGDIVVLDGYHFRQEYQRRVKSSGCRLVCIDDIHAHPFLADAIINHAGGIHPSDYEALPTTRFYLGLEYVLLRPAFLAAARTRRQAVAPNTRSLLICFGGADPRNDTLRVLAQAIEARAAAHYHLVVGSAYPHREALTSWVAGQDVAVSLHENLSAEAMAALMRECAQAVTPPSTVAYEYLCAGRTLYLHQIADNQRRMLDYLTHSGLAFHWGEFPVDAGRAARALEQRQAVFDGQSDRRIRAIFHALLLQARPARAEDVALFYAWANDPLVRAQSYTTAPIPWEDHQRWYANKIRQENVLLLVVEYAGQAAGQVRFEWEGEGRAILSYSLAAEYRGRGLSHLLLAAAIAYFRARQSGPLTVVGYVKKDNIASCRAFIKLNFNEAETDRYPHSYQYAKTYA